MPRSFSRLAVASALLDPGQLRNEEIRGRTAADAQHAIMGNVRDGSFRRGLLHLVLIHDPNGKR
jgi:hypothetical protein